MPSEVPDPESLLRELLVTPAVGSDLSLDDLRKMWPSKFRH